MVDFISTKFKKRLIEPVTMLNSERQQYFKFLNDSFLLERASNPASAAAAAARSLQSCLTVCDPIDGSPPGSPIPGILQARTKEWVAISFSNGWK